MALKVKIGRGMMLKVDGVFLKWKPSYLFHEQHDIEIYNRDGTLRKRIRKPENGTTDSKS